MTILTDLSIGIVALLHLLFMCFEMFFWQSKWGRKTFGMTKEAAAQTAILAKNQGLYNGFLAVGLIWTLFIPHPEFQRSAQTFLLSCIILAGCYDPKCYPNSRHQVILDSRA